MSKAVFQSILKTWFLFNLIFPLSSIFFGFLLRLFSLSLSLANPWRRYLPGKRSGSNALRAPITFMAARSSSSSSLQHGDRTSSSCPLRNDLHYSPLNCRHYKTTSLWLQPPNFSSLKRDPKHMQALGALRSRAPKSLATISPQNSALSKPLLNPSLPHPPRNKNTKSTIPTHSSLLQPLSRHSSLFLSLPSTAKIPVPYKLHKSQKKKIHPHQHIPSKKINPCDTSIHRNVLTPESCLQSPCNSPAPATAAEPKRLTLSHSLSLSNLNHINCSRLHADLFYSQKYKKQVGIRTQPGL